MTALMSWFLTVLGLLAFVVVLNHLGVDVSATIGSLVHSGEHVLGHPL